MKKITLVLLSAIILLSMAACGKEADKVSEVPQEDITDGLVQNEPPTIGEVVVYDQDDIRITAKSLETELINFARLNMFIENNSDTAVDIKLIRTFVNGFSIQMGLSETFAAGVAIDKAVEMNMDEFERCGISDIGEIEFFVEVSNPETGEVISVSEKIKIETSRSGLVSRSVPETEEIYSQEGIRVLSMGMVYNEELNMNKFEMYVENYSEQDILVKIRNVKVNGTDESPIEKDLEYIIGGRGYSDLTFDSSEWPDVIEGVTFEIVLLDMNTLEELYAAEEINM